MSDQMRNKKCEVRNESLENNRKALQHLKNKNDNLDYGRKCGCGGGVNEMEEWERELEEILEGERILVPVRREQVQKEQEAEIEQDTEIKQIPRRWGVK